MDALWISLGVVFVAELGDKTQLVALGLGARYRIALVFLGLSIAQAATMGLSVLAGGILGAAFPERAVGIGAGLAFFGFAIWTLRGDGDFHGTEPHPRVGRLVVVTVAVAVFVAELGDKTMLATAALATRQDLLWTWIGATVGVVAAGGLAIVAGNALGARVPERFVSRVAAALFALFGTFLLVDAIRG